MIPKISLWGPVLN